MKTYNYPALKKTTLSALLLLLSLSAALPAMAQKSETYRDSMYLTGRARNSFTREDLAGVRVLLLDAMGNIVDSTVTKNTAVMEGMKNICFDFRVRKDRTHDTDTRQ